MISSGFSKVNLEFGMGEFVVITGESGSGKTTLLNVISGLDTYEEGEMYIDGRETSHYSVADFEEYRKKYIGNIFQNFNLVSSYTVYQNIELILIINGYSKEAIKNRVPEIIKKVGLEEQTRSKVSKLSGGQKQRVSIARALAKDTPIIVADEPTGNLDSKSAFDIVKLLSEISKDKLVLVVTHNFEQFQEYATRVIKMNDGKIIEDKKLMEELESGQVKEGINDDISWENKVRLGVRNTFNLIPKFILLLVVFLFVILAVSGEYSSFKTQKDEAALLGYNEYFQNYSGDRIVVKKSDESEFTNSDYKKINKMNGVKSIVKDDILLDSPVSIESGKMSFYGYPYDSGNIKGSLDAGDMPASDDEVVLVGSKDEYQISGNVEEMLGKKYTLSTNYGMTMKVKVVGFQFIGDDDDASGMGRLYLSGSNLDKLRNDAYEDKSKIKTVINGTAYAYEAGTTANKIVANKNVAKGKALVSSEVDSYYDNGKATGKKIKISIKNLYWNTSKDLTVSGTYTQKNFKEKTGLKSFDENEGEIFINSNDYKNIFNAKNYQISVFADNSRTVEKVTQSLKDSGFTTLPLKDALQDVGGAEIIQIVKVPLAVLLVLAVFFIAFFVIRLILKSRGVYFSILRMLGLPKKNAKKILDIELFTVMNIAYLIFLGAIGLVKKGIISITYLQTMVDYLHLSDYIILYAVLIIMSYLISSKFARSLFKKSAMDTYRGEA